jgi:hypothetical protein
MKGAKVTLVEAKRQVGRVTEQMEAIRWQLLGIYHGLPEPLAERARLEDVGEGADPATDLRATIGCVLDDSIRPALEDLRSALEDTEDEPEEG